MTPQPGTARGRIVIVPGLAVREYAKPPAKALIRAGYRVSLLAPPTWRRSRTDLTDYGRLLAEDLERRDERVDLLVGLSLGTQAAAATAAISGRVAHVLLISPTVDPAYRSVFGLLGRWLGGDPDDEGQDTLGQIRDWSRAGVIRIAAGFASGLRTPIEDILPRISVPVTLARAEHDSLSTAEWVRSLARNDEDFRDLKNAPHSWPVGDDEGFVRMVSELLS